MWLFTNTCDARFEINVYSQIKVVCKFKLFVGTVRHMIVDIFSWASSIVHNIVCIDVADVQT